MFAFARRLTILCLCSSAWLACDSEGSTEDAGDALPDAGFEPVPCMVEAPTSCPDPAPRFGDVKPIFDQRCAGCHNGSWSGPWPLDTYSHVADWADTIRGHLISCTMPPPDAGMILPDDERTEILTWIRCGTPR